MLFFFIFFEPQQYRVRLKMKIKHHAKFTVIKSFLTCNTIIIWEIPFGMNVMAGENMNLQKELKQSINVINIFICISSFSLCLQ